MSSHEVQAAETDVAIIGMAGRFPGADDLGSFWRLLREGREGITRFGREELAAAGVPARLLDDPAYVPAHGIIPDVDLFDTGYFEFTPAEAAITDPQHRVLLTAGHAALEHAGYDPARYDGLISVYVGAAVNTYLQQQVLPNVDQTATSNHFAVMVGNDKDYLATRLSYKLDLKGPSYAVQTACSTSLVAVHLACQGLVNGECDIALAGGVTVKVPQEKGYLYEEGAILSRDGRVRTFDADASGTVLGNGVGVVVLKPLRDALADRDTVYAVIKGTATNNDGSGKVSFAAPGAAGQAAVIREAHTVSGVDPRSIGYVEAHGTATRLGDPVEVSALTRAFREATADTGFCAIGSVKSNLGHLDAAAGVAGLIKTALMLKHRTLVPTVNYTAANPAIDFAASPFEVSRDTVPWTGEGPLRAGVSSFGIGGTNAHAVLEEAPPLAVTGASRASQVLVVSARTPTALATAAAHLADHLDGDDPAALADIAYTLAVGRRAHEYRLAVTGADRAALADALRAAPVPGEVGGGQVSFVFTEAVPDAARLAREWGAAEPAFAGYYAQALGAGESFALQYALGRLWRDWGVTPVAVHGDGDAARIAACVTGALSLADALAGEGAPRRSRIPVRGATDEVRGVALGVGDGPWEGLARAWQAGAGVDWAAWFAGEERGRVPLPTYPFEGRRCWLDAPVSGPVVAAVGPHPMLDENVSTLDTLAYRSSRTGAEFYLADHRVGGEPVMPAAGQVELVRAAGALALGGPVALSGVSFERLLSYADGPRTALVRLWHEDGSVGFDLADGDETVASGAIRPAPSDPPAPVDLTPVADRCAEVVGHTDCYDVLRGVGLDYGARMRALREVRLGAGEALGVLELPEGAVLDGAVLNPALLDGALHALVVLLAREYGAAAGGFLPLALGELVVHAPVTGECRVHVTLGERGERTARAHVTLVDGHGRVLARIGDLAVRVLGEARESALLVRRWVDAPLSDTGVQLGGTARVFASPERTAHLVPVLADLGFTIADSPVPDVVLVDEPTPEQTLRVVRDLLAARPADPVRVLLLHRDDPALGAFARTVRAENPLLAIQAVELGDEAALGAELAGHGRDMEVSYRGGVRRVPAVEAAPEGGPVAVRDGGTYLVTGGAGGLGRIVAEWLLSRADARVVALGRGERPADLDERVVYRRADVTDRGHVAAVHAEFGPFQGVVHAAGVLRDGFVLTKSDEDLAAVLAPKAAGLDVLDSVTADDAPDFFVAFSSIAAHIGNPGQSDYAYANAFLEAHAERHGRITAVAWPLWAEGGMRQSAEDASDVAARTGFGVLPTAAGLALFERALGIRGAVVAAYGDVRRITAALAAPAPSLSRPAPAQTHAPRARAVELLRELIAAETGLDAAELVEEAPFERFGIDSLMIAKLNRELERHFTGLSKTLFFEYTTLGELADHFAERHAAELSEGGAPAPAATAPAVRAVHRRRPAAEQPDGDDAIAVVGLAGRYPDADDLDAFWANLSEGRDSITEIPNDRWDSTRWYDPDPAAPGLAHTRWGGFLRDVDRFDPLFFGISPRQAELMDPQERLFLQNAWHLLEDAGYRRADLAGRPVGVYVGVMYGEYQFHGALDALRGGRPLTGSSFATIANRVSHALNLSGPSMALDTMCSSSLTAIHLACASLRKGESELAVAGGVNVSVHPYKFGFLSQGRFLSDDGRCRAFGAGGSGYVPGEGVGAVLLKPYRRALADGDRIHGVILGSAINHGARTNGYSVPNPRAQQQVVTTALREAGVTPRDIGYVEAHGTGTSLGDPIELTGLTNAYASAGAGPGTWPIGSAKSNIGHLESAAGVAGLTKVLLQFRHRTLVPSLHAEELNPNIDFARSPFRVQRELSAWPEGDGPRRAGLSSFGAGGANAHLVLEESSRPDAVTEVPAGEQRVDEPVSFLLSARDEERLRVYADRAADFVATERVPLADLCFTTQVGREALDARFAVTVTDGAELVAALRQFADGGAVPDAADEQVGRWLRGEDVDWAARHSGRRRTRAPLYPFADEPYWIPLDAEFGSAAPHPLVDANESTVTGLRFRKTLRAADALLRDHVIEGRPLLAGAATLEFVRAAAALAEPGVRHALRDVVWGRAVELAGGELELSVSFRPEDGRLAFEVHSEDGTHARGIAVPADASATPASEDLAALRARLPVVRDRAAAYRDYADARFSYGPSFQVIDEIRAGAGEALVRLGAGQPWALLDGAFRACHWAAPWSAGLPVPFSLGSLDASTPLSEGCHAHARLVGESAGVRRFDVTVYDAQGEVVLAVRDFAGRTTSAPGEPRLYEPYWRPSPEPTPSLGEAAPALLVLGDHPALEAELAAGGLWTRVVAGEGLSALGAQDGLDVVLFGEPDDSLSPAVLLDRLCAPVLDVLDAVRTGVLTGRVRCVVVHREGRPEGAAFAGFALSTAPTAPRLELLTLAVPDAAPVDEVARAVAVELRAAPRAAGLEVRRTAAGEREVRALRAVTGAGGGVAVREGGVYVVTGGAGAIGRVLAEHLARARAAGLVLISRSEPDAETRAWHASLGCEVLALRADVADPAELEAALGAARERFGALHGVFHLAGVADEGRADGDRERFARVLAAKTHGLVHLDRLTRGDDLELFVVFSSVSSLVGDFGAASYATANRFADVYTVRRGGISLAWPLWSVGGVDGMVREEELAAYTRRSGMRALEAGQGVELLGRSLAAGVPWVVPAWGEPGVLDGALVSAGPAVPERQSAPSAEPTGPTGSSGSARRERLVEHLRGVLAGVLKLSTGRLDSRTPLDDYGLDSVLVMESNSLLGKDFPGLRGTVFFECRTVDELADHVLAEHADAVDRLFPDAPRATERPVTVERPPTPAAPAPVHRPDADEPIAVIGISGRYPGADTLDDFWRNLCEARDSVTEVPADRWDVGALVDSGHSSSRWGGFLSDVDSFDSLFFQISPKQARTMDPQERLFLQTAWSALENAGYPPARIPAPRFGGQGHDVGVFVGVMWDDYAILGATESARGNPQSVLANRSSIANQVSYFGDFRGPSVVVDTACSASLVAVHQACESIRRGECGYALAGGVNVAVHPDKYVHLSARSMLSDDGRCRAFGAGGTGYVPGEGVGAVLLKRLSDAVRDGDTVHAVIRATGVNHGGRTSGYTVPNPQAQQALVEQVLDAAGVDARTVGCVEAHGTGTALGDPIEHTALAQAFGKHTGDTGFCAIGSVKSNIGHLEGAAGIAGLTKAVLQLRHGMLLPSLHAGELNPVIDFERSPFRVQRELSAWPEGDGPRRAAVSSFGAGGTNAHVLLEEYVAPAPVGADSVRELIVLSARDEERLRFYAAELGRAVADAPRLTDVAHTLRVGREPLVERLAFVASGLADAAEKLAAVGRGEGGQWLHRGRVEQHPPLADLLTAGAGAEEFLAAQIDAGADDLLGRMWVSGVTVDWDLLERLRPAARRRVPLPTYPFERVRHWLDITTAPRPWRHRLTADAPVLRDHVVDGRPILPGVGHLDLVAEACGGLAGRALTDVRWIVPLALAGAAEEVTVAFDGDRYDVLGADGAVRSTGRLGAAGALPASLDVDALRARLEEGAGDFYGALVRQGLPYGPFFRRVGRVWTGSGEVLGRIGAVEGGPAHALHPGVLDAALHTYAALLGRRERPMLPFAADRVDVFGPVPESGWSYVRETGADRCEVLLCDDAGAVRVRFAGLAYREAKPSAVVVHRPVWTARPAEGRAEDARSVLYVGEPVAELHPEAQVRRVPLGFTDTEIGTPDLVYFFGTAPVREPVDRAALREAADRGPIALYRLVRALDRSGALERGVRLKVVTAGVHPLEDGDASSPWAAGLSGVAAVAAKEYPGLSVSLVDVRASEAGQAADAIVAEPFPAKPVPVSIRGGVRRVRTLERVELPAAAPRLRQGGVYLVVGGFGAVGRDTCLHLARAYGAKLVVVGRSPLDDERRRTVAELEKAGAEVRYLALDATDPAALTDAVDLAVREFGALHGVVNAAMVLVRQVLRELPEDALRAALEVKTGTAWAVLRAVRELPLDFALFYSSGVAFEANHGQAGYAAGCAFADAYAHHAARALPFPVHVLNLGYWHAGGDAERERVLSRFEAAGIRPLSAERGMAVVERTLGAGLPQVFALDADRPILDTLGIDADRTLKFLPGEAPGTLPEVRFPTGPDPELAAHQRAVSEVEVLAVRLLAAVLGRAGLTEAAHVVPEHRELFAVQLGMVRSAGLEGRSVEPEAELVGALRELTDRHPALAPVVTLLSDCLTALPDVLTGRRPAMEVLFPDGSTERVAAVYRGDPVTDRCNAEVARIVVEQVKARQGAGKVRVLEVGAGTGGTTAAVLAALAPYGDAVEYVFTDVSPAFVRKAKGRFGERYPFVRFEVLDIEAGVASGGYDVVFGTNVLHATRRLSGTLARAKGLLRRGGALLAVEGTRPRHQLALVFGLTTGWWLFDDPEQRMPGSPLASERQWRDALAACGFTGISVGAPESEAGAAFQSVIAAVSDGVVPAGAVGAVESAAATPVVETVVPAAPSQDGDALRQVTRVFAEVLEMTPEQLDPDLTFEHYGVDSLVVLELTRALEAVYGPQSATLLFERITIRQLADHFRPEAPATAPPVEAPPVDEAERLVAGLSDEAVEELLAELLSQQGESEGGGR